MTLWIWTSHAAIDPLGQVFPILPCPSHSFFFYLSSVKVNSIQVEQRRWRLQIIPFFKSEQTPKQWDSFVAHPNLPVPKKCHGMSWAHIVRKNCLHFAAYKSPQKPSLQVILRFYVFSASVPTVPALRTQALCLGLCDGQGSCEALLEAPLLQELLGQEPMETLDSG